METTRNRLLNIMVGFTIGALLLCAAPVAAQSDCKPILDASSKVFNTPAHVYVTGKTDGLTVTAEMIYTAGTVYMKINGKWNPGGTTKDMEQLSQKKPKKSNGTCRYVKDELVNGEMAAVYGLTEKGTIDSQIWISKAKGLPLREEDDIDLGPGKGKTHNSTRYEYGNIKPPI
ncbi:MAG TPA: hypothetical protein VKR61_01015 [Bryobacteraceae bacterium]|nr:hypothetical protein [Bryobacteraceae bacterium]